MDMSSPARLYAALVGGVLVIVGILGFFWETSFAVGDDLTADEFIGVFAVNGWHNVVHLLTGLLGLALVNTAAREYALGIGAIYVVIAIWGFIAVNGGVGDLVELVPVDTEDNWLHLVLGVVGLAAGAATPLAERSSTTGPTGA